MPSGAYGLESRQAPAGQFALIVREKAGKVLLVMVRWLRKAERSPQ